MAETRNRRRPPFVRVVFYLAVLLAMGVAMLELGLRAVVFQKTSFHPTAIGQAFYDLQVRTYVEGSLERTFDDPTQTSDDKKYNPDDLVGWTYVQGDRSKTRSFAYLGGAMRSSHRVNLRVGEDGYRVTSRNPSQYAGKPEIHVYGGSRTFGHGVSDEETFAWKIQEAFPDYHVRNLAQGGFGNVQGFVQLRDAIARGNPPKVAIFMYAPFHMFRNYGTPSWLGRGVRSDELQAVVARIENGELVVKRDVIERRSADDPPFVEIIEVTSRLFQEARQLCEDHGIVPVLG
ncbi:MAG: hypothetical protein KDB80_06340, partial [Planctomycetes bacterium]|nr:hypothetical protein [Planctomycetota bacterium]